jgi:hypothetical protein
MLADLIRDRLLQERIPQQPGQSHDGHVAAISESRSYDVYQKYARMRIGGYDPRQDAIALPNSVGPC